MHLKQYVLSQNSEELPPVNVTWDSKSGFLFDCGPANIQSFMDFKTQFNEDGFTIMDIQAIILTHHHIDHIGGLRYFPTSIPVFVQKNAQNFQGLVYKDILEIEKLIQIFESDGTYKKQIAYRMMMEYDESESLSVHPTVYIEDELQLGDWNLIASQGHSSSDLICYNSVENHVISGDIVLPNIFFNTIIEFDPQENGFKTMRSAFKQELMTLYHISPETIYVGHGQTLNYENLVTNISNTEKRMKRTEKKVNKQLSENMNTSDLIKTVFKTFIRYEYFLPFSEVMSVMQTDVSNIY
ncbi:MBL fold metallo-hydrolase [Weissella confusa]|uniref:MBL fold metallo-hydrolase n=1 Tax=Weissella confusa TaxID=1583 RepID=UPI001C6FABE1|nr:MBL fold metallo-hydrolase [Weissella confusa]QYU56735.1 MBL fold metallo-hydrolase [Weissella confusa]